MEGPVDIEMDAVTALNRMMVEGDEDEIFGTDENDTRPGVYTDIRNDDQEEEEGPEEDPMDVDAEYVQEGGDAATLPDVAIPLTEGPINDTIDKNTSPEEGEEEEEEGDETDDGIKSLSSLLGEFEEKVVGSIDELDESTREVTNCRIGVDEWLEKHVREANLLAQAVPVEQRLGLNDSEQHLRGNMTNLADAVAMNSAQIKLCYENIRLFVAGLILQLSKGSQHAPFLVHRPLEDIDIGFNTDNPALPPNPSTDKMQHIETLRAPFFDDSSSDEGGGGGGDDEDDDAIEERGAVHGAPYSDSDSSGLEEEEEDGDEG
jgi:hypothetical protein